MALISIIIPVYNGEKYIEQTIRSVLAQTFQDFEIIVVDDSSEDKTLEIVQSIQDSRIRILSYPHAGCAASRNKGIVAAQGEYIAFLDADDLWTSDKLESQLDQLRNDPNAAVAYSWVDLINAQGDRLGKANHFSFLGDVYKDLLVVCFLDCGSNILVRRSVLERTGVFDESLSSAEDWDLYIRIAAHYRFIVIPKVQVFYRLHLGSKSMRLRNTEVMGRRVIRKAFKMAPPSLRHLKRTSLANWYRFLFHRSRDIRRSRATDRLAAKFLIYTFWYGDPYIKRKAGIAELIRLTKKGWLFFS